MFALECNSRQHATLESTWPKTNTILHLGLSVEVPFNNLRPSADQLYRSKQK